MKSRDEKIFMHARLVRRALHHAKHALTQPAEIPSPASFSHKSFSHPPGD